MSNFTKSVFYTTSILVAGLVGMSALYNSSPMFNDGSSFANIAPAANKSDIGIDPTDIMRHMEKANPSNTMIPQIIELNKDTGLIKIEEKLEKEYLNSTDMHNMME